MHTERKEQFCNLKYDFDWHVINAANRSSQSLLVFTFYDSCPGFRWLDWRERGCPAVVVEDLGKSPPCCPISRSELLVMEGHHLSVAPRSRSVIVEEKTFDFMVMAQGFERVLITEKEPKGIFKGSMSIDSGRWNGEKKLWGALPSSLDSGKRKEEELQLHMFSSRGKSEVLVVSRDDTENSSGSGGGVQVNAHGGLVHNSWWITTVICSTDCTDPDWGWVEQRVNGVFNSANLQVIEGLEAGSIDIAKEAKQVHLKFYGIPFHLRVYRIMEDLAAYCGKVLKIDESLLRPSTKFCAATIVTKDLESIPRKIQLEERGYFFSVWVEVDLRSLAGDRSERMVAPPSSLRVEPVVVCRPTLAADMGQASNSGPANPPGFPGHPMAAQPTMYLASSPAQQWIQPVSAESQPRSVSKVANTPMGSMNAKPDVNSNRFAILNVESVDSLENTGDMHHLEGPNTVGSEDPLQPVSQPTIVRIGPQTSEPVNLGGSMEVEDISKSGDDIQSRGEFKQFEETPNLNEIATQLLKCQTPGEISNWIDWLVIPLAKSVEITSPMNHDD
ncbi:hypothetical protein FRX31_024101 [Thalictrum thalictroides]|uniref:Uncharacterized protein n=1 Tax=Thalictrum thalictroides TaxID=46969 RepID=A0A7J6VN30_THATH|nr:hypothetical protein FRX31_024101 [Thalictrum thalictroides]